MGVNVGSVAGRCPTLLLRMSIAVALTEEANFERWVVS